VAFALMAVAASVYLVLVLEILKFKRFRERELQRQVETGEIPALSASEIDSEIEREVETGEFTAVRLPDGDGGPAPPDGRGAPHPPETDEFEAVTRRD
jgi:UDP-GlcNAc:undecaprenyl-phosphate GlcNAc-1-phosphate transferase